MLFTGFDPKLLGKARPSGDWNSCENENSGELLFEDFHGFSPARWVFINIHSFAGHHKPMVDGLAASILTCARLHTDMRVVIF